ncbi:hypothetical protein [Flavobacterium sp. ov086]|uniref:hypothetical protein n=1 Tax=Flavobacterium sp. ov086 TaxID=1761785 RepID=UPI0015959341|nr:hypothetical protein [Flavobacterium sp. ov086]
MIVFSYFGKDPSARRIVGLKANSVTTNEYQSAFREGGGMAIAALARISQWDKNGEFTSKQYLDGAKRAYMHLLQNNMDGYPMWQWFSDFMGGIRFVDYIPTFGIKTYCCGEILKPRYLYFKIPPNARFFY